MLAARAASALPSSSTSYRSDSLPAPPDATNCNDVVNAVHVSTENPGDACLFLIPDPDPNVVVDAYRITVNGAYLPQDTINGWTYTDATQRVIRIVGPTCDAIKAALSAVFA